MVRRQRLLGNPNVVVKKESFDSVLKIDNKETGFNSNDQDNGRDNGHKKDIIRDHSKKGIESHDSKLEGNENGNENENENESKNKGNLTDFYLNNDRQDILICPVCDETMITLAQLNRHLNDAHFDVKQVDNEDLGSWLKKRVEKAKKFQPVHALNQKLNRFDLFDQSDSNASSINTLGGLQSNVDSSKSLKSNTNSDSKSSFLNASERSDIFVTRSHWQKETSHDVCSFPNCKKHLNTKNGSIHCRRCGKLFCLNHTKFYIKLSEKAKHDPQNGIWCTVCQTCYKSRKGYNDHTGFSRDLSIAFVKIRNKKLEKLNLDANLLETRLARLTYLIANDSNNSQLYKANLIDSLPGFRKHVSEKKVTKWQNDKDILSCPICHRKFGITLRKHHCRLCGKVICSDSKTECSQDYNFNISIGDSNDEKHNEEKDYPNDGQTETTISVKICKDCSTIVFDRKNFKLETKLQSRFLKTYNVLLEFQESIINMSDKFQKLLQQSYSMSCNKDNSIVTKELTSKVLNINTEASKLRKRIIECFIQYNLAAKKIKAFQTDSPTQIKLQNSIFLWGSIFLQQYMIPLKSAPSALTFKKMLITKNSKDNDSTNNSNNNSSTDLKSLDFDLPVEVVSLKDLKEGNAVSHPKLSEEKIQVLNEKLIVLQEQKFMVEQMIEDFSKRRKYDDLNALQQNLTDIDYEIGKISSELGKDV